MPTNIDEGRLKVVGLALCIRIGCPYEKAEFLTSECFEEIKARGGLNGSQEKTEKVCDDLFNSCPLGIPGGYCEENKSWKVLKGRFYGLLPFYLSQMIH